MLLPGPEAMQLAVYIGWLMHRTIGGIITGLLFVLPGVVAIMALSWVYALYGNVGPVEALFFGLKAAVLAIVVQAVIRIRRARPEEQRDVRHCRSVLRGNLRVRDILPPDHPGCWPDRFFWRAGGPAGVSGGAAAMARSARCRSMMPIRC
jgi:hypothetical protein